MVAPLDLPNVGETPQAREPDAAESNTLDLLQWHPQGSTGPDPLADPDSERILVPAPDIARMRAQCPTGIVEYDESQEGRVGLRRGLP